MKFMFFEVTLTVDTVLFFNENLQFQTLEIINYSSRFARTIEFALLTWSQQHLQSNIDTLNKSHVPKSLAFMIGEFAVPNINMHKLYEKKFSPRFLRTFANMTYAASVFLCMFAVLSLSFVTSSRILISFVSEVYLKVINFACEELYYLLPSHEEIIQSLEKQIDGKML